MTVGPGSHERRTSTACGRSPGSTLDADRLDRDAFVARFGGVFEESPWIAARGVGAAPVRERRRRCTRRWSRSSTRRRRDDRLALIRAHPDLGRQGARSPAPDAESTREQAAAGLDRLTPAQYERITALTAAYRERFGFPFVVCAREHTPDTIIAAAEARAGADPDEEERTALAEIAKIARLRLDDLVERPMTRI